MPSLPPHPTEFLPPPWSAPAPLTCHLNDWERTVTVIPCGDGTLDDFAAVNSAWGLLPTDPVTGYPIGRVRLAPGDFWSKGATIVPSPQGIMEGAGLGTVLHGPAGADGIRWLSTVLPPDNPAPGGPVMGTLRDFTIRGDQAGANAVGLHMGDGVGFHVDKVMARDYAGTGCAGFFMDNSVNWTEKCKLDLISLNNTTALIKGTTTGKQSFEYNDIYLFMLMQAGQNGVQLGNNGAYMDGGSLTVRANCGTSSIGALGTSVLQISGSGGGFNAHYDRTRLDIACENTGGTFAPQTINFGTSSNTITDCMGILAFQGSGWVASNVGAANLKFGGIIVGDANLLANNNIPTGWA